MGSQQKNNLAGTYIARETTISGPDKIIIINLKKDNTFVINADYTKYSFIVQKGKWKLINKKILQLEYTESDSKPYKEELLVVLKGNTLRFIGSNNYGNIEILRKYYN